MSYLLDTHALIWYFEDSHDLPDRITAIIDDAVNKKFICSVSLWEIAIKMNNGKLEMKFSLDELLAEIANSDLNILQVENEYLKKLSEMPFFHTDPFDRLIMATSLVENMTIITIDKDIQKYDVPWIW